MARDLVASGAGIAALQVAGRWASAQMPAHYARAELASREGSRGPVPRGGLAESGRRFRAAGTAVGSEPRM